MAGFAMLGIAEHKSIAVTSLHYIPVLVATPTRAFVTAHMGVGKHVYLHMMASGTTKKLASLTYMAWNADKQQPLQLEDVKVSLSASTQFAQLDDVASGTFQLSASSAFLVTAGVVTQPGGANRQPNRLAHHWQWQPQASHVAAHVQHAGLPITSKSVSLNVHAGHPTSSHESQALIGAPAPQTKGGAKHPSAALAQWQVVCLCIGWQVNCWL